MLWIFWIFGIAWGFLLVLSPWSWGLSSWYLWALSCVWWFFLRRSCTRASVPRHKARVSLCLADCPICSLSWFREKLLINQFQLWQLEKWKTPCGVSERNKISQPLRLDVFHQPWQPCRGGTLTTEDAWVATERNHRSNTTTLWVKTFQSPNNRLKLEQFIKGRFGLKPVTRMDIRDDKPSIGKLTGQWCVDLPPGR